MAKTLTNIETSVRYMVDDDRVVFTNGPGNKIFNSVYRKLCAAFPWAELIKKTAATDNTEVSKAVYTMPTTPVYADLQVVEISTLSNDSPTAEYSDIWGVDEVTAATARLNYKTIEPAPNEWDWNLAGQKVNQLTPDYYKRFYDVSTTLDAIEFRPAPSTVSGAIQFTGVVEPTEISTPAGTTIFWQSNADDALEHLLAAAMYSKGEKEVLMKSHLNTARTRLVEIWGNERVTTEVIEGII